MNTKWILIVISLTILVFGANAKKTRFDRLTVDNPQSSEELESRKSKSDRLNNLEEELPSDQKTKNYEIKDPNVYSKGRKMKKYDPETSKKHPLKNKEARKQNEDLSKDDSKIPRGKKYSGKSSEKNPKNEDKKLYRNKREALREMWDGVEVPRTRFTKIKKKELMDQENTGIDGEMMPPFESEVAFEKFERDQISSTPTSSVFNETEFSKKSKFVKKYHHLEGIKKGKLNKEEKAEKHVKADKSSKEKKDRARIAKEIAEEASSTS